MKKKNYMYKSLATNKKPAIISIHIGFWLLHFLLRINFAGYFYDFDNQRLLAELIFLPVRIAATYYTIYVLIYNYLLRKEFVKFFVFLIISVVLAVFANRILQFGIVFHYNLTEPKHGESFFNILQLIHSTIYIYPIVGIAAIIVLIKNWFDEQRLRYELAKEKLEAELKLLKAQIHPHFLFNTINNIYSLALDKSDKTAGSLLKLSDLLSYMIYDSNVPEVQLEKEVEVLNDYIELEKIRYGNKLDFSFEIRGNLSFKTIAPLLLLPITENCFKHGAGESVDKSYIKLSLIVDDKQITFSALNNIASQKKNQNENGIGLLNLKKRLELIYKENHELIIDENEKEFKVVLKIFIDK